MTMQPALMSASQLEILFVWQATLVVMKFDFTIENVLVCPRELSRTLVHAAVLRTVKDDVHLKFSISGTSLGVADDIPDSVTRPLSSKSSHICHVLQHHLSHMLWRRRKRDCMTSI